MLKFIGNTYLFLNKYNNILGSFLSAIVAYKTLYFLIGIFFTRKFKPAKRKHKYGIVIAARNEENVIGNLIDSINLQDYPKDLLTIFVVADNCTDNTAKISRSKGAICYERFDNEHRTKGYALEFLFDRIEEDYGRDSFDGYFVFDADNLLKSDYISRMNDAFDEGAKIITSYRNTKNFDENWISSTYALHWIRSIRFNHRARSVLRLATNIQGTGFLFSNEVVHDGWHYTSLTEDRALTVDAVAQGYEITYQDKAMFYDEQPTNLKICMRQRIRWAKGHLQAFGETGPYLFMNVFLGKHYVKTKWKKTDKKKDSFIKRVIESIRHRLASYDTLMQLTPVSVINVFRWLFVSLFVYSCYVYNNGLVNIKLFNGSVWLAKLLNNMFKVRINIGPGYKAMVIGFLLTIFFRILYRVGTYFVNIWRAIYIFIIENKNIKKFSIWKKMLYCFTWPIFDIIGRYSTYIALFTKVEWKPIPHDSKVTINDLTNNN